MASYTPLANPPQSIESGNYGRPPRATWWFKQSIIYFIGLLGMKICVFFIIQLVPFVVKVGDWALQWTEGNAAVQIFFVMLLFPVIMNAIQYYIIDTFIKKPASHGDDMLTDDEAAAHGEEHDHHRALLAGVDDDDTLEDDSSVHKGPKSHHNHKDAYNVFEPGHSASSSSSSNHHIERHDEHTHGHDHNENLTK